MTDIPNLRPRNDALKVLATLAGLGVIAWGVASWAARTPSPEKVERLSVDLTEVRLNVAVMKVQLDGITASVNELRQKANEQPPPKGHRDR